MLKIKRIRITRKAFKELDSALFCNGINAISVDIRNRYTILDGFASGVHTREFF